MGHGYMFPEFCKVSKIWECPDPNKEQLWFISLMSNLKPRRAIHSLVANDTTGKDLRMLRHFSRSINKEFDLIFRSCSSLALFCSKTWNNAWKSESQEREILSSLLLLYLMSHFSLIQFPVKQINALLKLAHLQRGMIHSKWKRIPIPTIFRDK